MNNNHISELLHEYIDGTLPPDRKQTIEEHLGRCEECSLEVRSMREMIGELHRMPYSIEPPPDLLSGIEKILSQQPQPHVDGGLGQRRNGTAAKNHTKFLTTYTSETVSYAAYLRIAAVVVLLAACGVVWFIMKNSSSEQLVTSNDVGKRETPGEQKQSNGAGNLSGEQQSAKPSPQKSLTSSATVNPKKGKSTVQSNTTETTIGKTVPVIPGEVATRSTGNDLTDQHPSATPSPNFAATQPDKINNQSHDRRNEVSNHLNPKIVSNVGKITGQVTDSTTGDPLPSVNVLIVGTSLGAVTDANGNFTIFHVPVGSYTIRSTNIGYGQLSVADVKVGGDMTTQVDFRLAPGTVEVNGITITADQQLVNKMTTSSTQTVNLNQASAAPSEKGVANVPGLQYGIVRQGNNGYLRGGRAGDVEYRGHGRVYRQNNFNTEQYDRVNENVFLDALTNPLSTFSIDVDNASYANVRRFINSGQLPPKDAVRIEELINYFTYKYPQPEGNDPFSITTEMASCPWNSSNNLLLVGLQGKKIATENLPPSNLVFLIDVSGSMNEPNKLPLVKAAFRLLVDQLRGKDRVSIVVYAGRAGLVLPSTSGNEKERILSTIDELEAGGSTAGGQGIVLAYKIAEENFMREGNNRVILATDGDFNVGVSSDGELERLIEEKRKSGVYLSVLGFGTGNYKDSKMEKLADKGNGNYAYIDNLQEARKVFIGQMAGTLFTIAKDVKVQIEFNPMKIKAYRLIGYEDRMLAKEDFNNDRKDAGEIGAGHTVTAMYEIVPADGYVELPNIDSLRYQSTHVNTHAKELLTLKFRYKSPGEEKSKLILHPLEASDLENDGTSENFRWATAVAEFGMVLTDSRFKGSASFGNVLELAEDARGSDREGYRSEFIRLVEMCRDLSKSMRDR